MASLTPSPCPFFNVHLRQCAITKYFLSDAKAIEYCKCFSNQCYFRHTKYQLQPTEFTYSATPTNQPLPNQTFINNKGVRFLCIDEHTIECPFCQAPLHIQSFQFGIFCPHCQKQIH